MRQVLSPKLKVQVKESSPKARTGACSQLLAFGPHVLIRPLGFDLWFSPSCLRGGECTPERRSQKTEKRSQKYPELLRLLFASLCSDFVGTGFSLLCVLSCSILLALLLALNCHRTDTLDGTLKWRYRTDGKIRSSPAITPDGSICFGSSDGYLYCLNPDGTLKWRHQTPGDDVTSPLIAASGTIWVVSSSSSDAWLQSLDPDGALLRSRPTSGSVLSEPALGADGTIYFGAGDGFLHAISPDSETLNSQLSTFNSQLSTSANWVYLTDGLELTSPAVGLDGTICVSADDNCLYAVNPDGSLKWRHALSATITTSPVIGDDGTIYVGLGNHYLYALDADGDIRWRTLVDEAIVSSPVLGPDGMIYFGCLDGRLYAVNSDPLRKWRYGTRGPVWSSPAVGADGTSYVGSCDKSLHAVGSDGNKKWSYGTQGDVMSAPVMGPDGTIYFGSDDHYLYAINTSNLPVSYLWSMFRHDPQHTGRAR